MNVQPKSESQDQEQKAHETNASPEDAEPSDKRELLPTPNELVTLLSKRVIGHEEAKRSIAVAVYQHLINCATADTYGGRVETENHVLPVGSSGSGKSLLLRTLGDVLPIPLFHVSCTNISPNGYKGEDLQQHLDAIGKSIVDVQFTHPAIVVWDEVDKLSLHESNDSSAFLYAG